MCLPGLYGGSGGSTAKADRPDDVATKPKGTILTPAQEAAQNPRDLPIAPTTTRSTPTLATAATPTPTLAPALNSPPTEATTAARTFAAQGNNRARTKGRFNRSTRTLLTQNNAPVDKSKKKTLLG